MPSRPDRWYAAAAKLQEASSMAADALSELESLQEEYSEWHDNLPDNTRGSATDEKLEAIVNLDLDNPLEDLAGEVEGIECPLGFGRD